MKACHSNFYLCPSHTTRFQNLFLHFCLGLYHCLLASPGLIHQSFSTSVACSFGKLTFPSPFMQLYAYYITSVAFD
ncbi:MAG: hypothetical protein ACTS8A_00700 [Arsenophonus sp. ET-LJ4-MAG3]